jgi:hypothetical protein
MKKTVWIFVPVVILLAWLARSWYWDHELSREEAAVRKMLVAQESRFRDVRIYRSKSHYNLLEGQVMRSEDIDYLTNETARLGVRRCIVAVRADNAMEKK